MLTPIDRVLHVQAQSTPALESGAEAWMDGLREVAAAADLLDLLMLVF